MDSCWRGSPAGYSAEVGVTSAGGALLEWTEMAGLEMSGRGIQRAYYEVGSRQSRAERISSGT